LIEIKKGNDYYPKIIEKLATIIERKNASDFIIIQAFETQILKDVHAQLPEIRIHKLFVAKMTGLPILLCPKPEWFNYKDYPFVSEYAAHYRFASKHLRKWCAKQGKLLNVWTVNDPIIANQLMDRNVGGIITDNPQLIRNEKK
jgi:glycerophosphoryl diester phosphodiesterase